MESLSVAIRGEVPDIGQAFIFPRIDLGPAVIPPEDETPDLALQARRGMEIDLEAATKVDRVIFRLGTSGLSLETGNLAAPMQALNVCALDLIRAWGLDPAEHSGHTPPHWLNQDTIIEALSDRYPDRAAIRGERGIFWVRVIVEKDGSVSQCHVDEATQTRVLETPACEEFARAQFDPARTSSGEAMRSFFTTSIFYAGDLGG
ncbi:MAG: TonB family protein [Pseudomonadota bacterium]